MFHFQNNPEKHAKSIGFFDMIRLYSRAMKLSGYDFQIRFDMDNWMSSRLALDPTNHHVMPTFNPEYCDQSNSYWINTTYKGRTVAIIAARKFICDDFIEPHYSGHVWSDNPTHERLTLALPPDLKMPGPIWYRGGMCICPDHRGTGLSWALSRIVSLLSIADGAEKVVGHNFDDLYRSGFSARVYGHRHAALCFDGTEEAPPTGNRSRIFLVWTDFKDVIVNAQRDFSVLVCGDDQELRDIARVAQRPD